MLIFVLFLLFLLASRDFDCVVFSLQPMCCAVNTPHTSLSFCVLIQSLLIFQQISAGFALIVCFCRMSAEAKAKKVALQLRQAHEKKEAARQKRMEDEE